MDAVSTFQLPTDRSYLLDVKGTILSVFPEMSDVEVGTPLQGNGLGRSYLDFCTGPASGVVRLELESLLSGRIRHFSTIYDCSVTCDAVVPIALIGTAIENSHQPLFNLRHIPINYSSPDIYQISGDQSRVSLLLKDFFADPTRDRWVLVKDQSALRTLEHLFATLESIRTSMDEAVYCHDNGLTYRQLSQLLIQTASVVDMVLEQVSPRSVWKNKQQN